MVQEQKNKSGRKAEETEEVKAADVRNEELAQATDDALENIDDVLADQFDEELLADMDDVLEENAELFVAEYIQKGGE